MFSPNRISAVHIPEFLIDGHTSHLFLLVASNEGFAPDSCLAISSFTLTVLEGEHYTDLQVCRAVILNGPHENSSWQTRVLNLNSCYTLTNFCTVVRALKGQHDVKNDSKVLMAFDIVTLAL